MSQNSLNPATRVFAVVGSFMALGVIVVAASQGGASATSTEQAERAAKIASVHATSQNVLAPVSQNAAFARALIAGFPTLAQPGNQPSAIKLAKQTCNLLPTWGAQQERVSAKVAEIVGSAVSPAELTTFASAAAIAYCPSQLANAQR